MNKYHGFAILMLIFGIVLLGYSITTGEAEIFWFLIFPVFSGQGFFSFIGTLLIISAILVGIYAFIQSGDWVLAEEDDFDEIFSSKKRSNYNQRPQQSHGRSGPPESRPRPKVSGGGVVLIGPIPIIFGSDKKSAILLSVLAVIIMVIALIAIFSGYLLTI